MRYARPKSVEEALHLIAERPWRVLAGGTDFYPSQGRVPFATTCSISTPNEADLAARRRVHPIIKA